MNKGLWNEALHYYELSRAIREETGYRSGLARMLWYIGDVYEKQMRLAEAEQMLGQAVRIYEEVGSPELEKVRKQLDKIKELQQTASQK